MTAVSDILKRELFAQHDLRGRGRLFQACRLKHEIRLCSQARRNGVKRVTFWTLGVVDFKFWGHF